MTQDPVHPADPVDRARVPKHWFYRAGGVSVVVGIAISSLLWWAVIFMSEADGCQQDSDPPPVSHCCYRHCPGVGSWASMLIVRNNIKIFARSVACCGGCGASHMHQQVQRYLFNSKLVSKFSQDVFKFI